jgi:hypothetical protein
MRFLQIVMGAAPRSGPPDPEHMAKARKAIEEEIASGKLVATGGLGKRATAAARVTSKGGEVTVEDPPTGDGWMAGGGYTLYDVASKEEAVERAKLTLKYLGDGTVELIQVTEMHPPPKPRPG